MCDGQASGEGGDEMKVNATLMIVDGGRFFGLAISVDEEGPSLGVRLTLEQVQELHERTGAYIEKKGKSYDARNRH